MPRHEVPWPQWTAEEDIVAAWFLSRGLEAPDVARIMTQRLLRPTRKVVAFIRRMEGLNRNLARMGYQKLCTEGMFDWDKAAVDDFLIDSTDDRGRLINLLSFDSRHTWLLKTYIDLNIPLEEVFRVGDMQQELDRFFEKHREFWSTPYPRRSGRFY